MLRGALLSARPMVVESAVCLMVEEFAQKACMEAQISVWPMVVENGVLFLGAPRVHVDALTAVSGMEEESVVKLKTVERVPKAVPTSARPMAVGRDAAGERENVKNLLGGRVGSVLHTAAC